MRPERVASALQSVVDGLRSSNRRVWWTSFVIVSLLTGLWVLADPPYAGPDEQAHVIKAVALDHGQLTGSELSPYLRNLHKDDRQDFLMVQVPAIYSAEGSTACFAYQRASAICIPVCRISSTNCTW